MLELNEKDLINNEWTSSKGNQFKWKKDNVWYKADFTGYEALAEYTISHLLKYSNLDKDKYVLYNLCEVKYKNNVFRVAKSNNFLKNNWQLITIERLYKNYKGRSLHEAIWSINDHKERLKFLVDEIEKITGLNQFGKYMNILLTVDSLFLNEDRHTHNIAVLMNEEGKFDYCPIFDNGAGLLSDTILEYPLDSDIYKMIDTVKAKPFDDSFEEQVNYSEILYKMNIIFEFNKKDVLDILCIEKEGEASIYPIEIRNRVKDIIFEQMRKYPYLFENRQK